MEQAKVIDDALHKWLGDLVGINDLCSLERMQLELPLAMGGFSFGNTAQGASLSRLSGGALAAPRAKKLAHTWLQGTVTSQLLENLVSPAFAGLRQAAAKVTAASAPTATRSWLCNGECPLKHVL